jgi:hypothetical protein
LVDSYVGAIGLGYVLVQGVLYFVNIFISPVASWISRNQYGELVARANYSTAFSLKDGLLELIRFALLLLVWFVLLRWLYLGPGQRTASEPDLAG